VKYLNAIIFVFLSLLYLALSSHIKFSTNFIDIFLSQKSLKIFHIAKEFGFSNEILISKKGFDKKSLKELQEVAKELKKIPQISKVEISSKISPKLRKYMAKNYYLLADFNDTKITNTDIKNRLKKIYKSVATSVIYQPINKYDPLELFSMDFQQTSKYQKLKNYGYLIRATTWADTSNAQTARVVYEDIEKLLTKFPGVVAISPFFYLVENSSYIKADAQKIMLISTLLLLLLYFVILKNHKLLFNAILAIASSILSAIILTSFIFDSINILAIVFGVSVTSISIDYMFHYYFHGYFSKSRYSFQKRVFFGFFTTVGVFIIFGFINIDLFKQLAIFSVISLSMAYVLFSFTFIYLDIKKPVIVKQEEAIRRFNPLHVALISLALLAYAFFHLSFDNNLKNLDYHNTKLLNLSKLFNRGLQNNNYQAVIIEAKSRDKLLEKYEKIEASNPAMLGIGKFVLSKKRCEKRVEQISKFDFEKVKKTINQEAKKIGFNDVFKDAYKGIDSLKCKNSLNSAMRFKIIKDKNSYYTLALIPKKSIKSSNLFSIVDLGKSLAKDTREMKEKLQLYMLISVAFIVLVLFFNYGFKMLFPLSFLLFPLSVVLFGISLFGKINIMNIFALVILIAISIDYGIYLHKTSTPSETKMAIKYALMSTFLGFGVLIFSKTVALYSIGFVITLGIGSIFLLLYTSL